MRGPKAADLLARLFREERAALVAIDYPKGAKVKVIRRFDEYAKWADDFCRPKVIVFKWHFNKLWMENYYCLRPAKRSWNTACQHIHEVLMKVGKEQGWLR